ncbi:hypothetical protein [Anaerotalea alkaliphila]|uniref:Uncharacterized protein n=1 Tax=Anaerotalea alkaliphila TaxID=2662126 RepID=A0A7X5HY39_9FIRM|nr:hypothetical protein [Anaerotalea alkaliphila]NDL68721.1 hypothetical protein [Anaerotalea alkaliphila]
MNYPKSIDIPKNVGERRRVSKNAEEAGDILETYPDAGHFRITSGWADAATGDMKRKQLLGISELFKLKVHVRYSSSMNPGHLDTSTT